MADLTPEELWSDVHEIGTDEPVQGGPGGNDNLPHQHLLNRIEFLRRRVGVQGTWDMTGAVVQAEPAASGSLQATLEKVSDASFNLTPGAGDSLLKVLRQQYPTAKTAGTKWARIRRPDHSGTNAAVALLAIANAEATAADVVASVSGVLTGTCTYVHFVVIGLSGVAVPAGAVILRSFTASGASETIHDDSAAIGDDVHVGFDPTTGVVSIGVAGGDVADIPTADPAPGSIRLFVVSYHTAATPTGSLVVNFDMSTPDEPVEGAVGFMMIADAEPPVGAADHKMYLVSAPGFYAGKQTEVDDVVMLTDDMGDILIFRLITDDRIAGVVAEQVPISDRMDLLTFAKAKGHLLDVGNEPSEIVTYTRGDVILVASTPAGDFEGFTAWQPVIYSGTEWVQHTRADLFGCTFMFFGLPGLRLEFAKESGGLSMSPPIGLSEGLNGRTYEIGSATVTEYDLATLAGIRLHEYPSRGGQRALFADFQGSTEGTVLVGLSPFIDVVVDDDFDLTIDITGLISDSTQMSLVRIYNSDAAAHTFTISGAPADDNTIIPAEGELYFLYVQAGRTPGVQSCIPLYTKPRRREVQDTVVAADGGSHTPGPRDSHTSIGVGAIFATYTLNMPAGLSVGERWTVYFHVTGGGEITALTWGDAASITVTGPARPTTINTSGGYEFVRTQDGWALVR